MTQKTGIAIIGAGRWGQHFVRQFLGHPLARVVAIVDSHVELLQALKQRYALEEQSVQLATDWTTVRQLPAIEAVVVATPASSHYLLIKDALSLGYHVLAEKPLALDPQQCLDLSQLALQQQRQLWVDHTYLFHPAVVAGLSVLRSGQLGQLRYGYASRTHLGPVRQDVDALWDLAIHDIAIFNTWLAEIPVQVQAQGSNWLPGDRHLSDLVWSRLFYPSGFQATIHHCWLNPDKQRRLTVVGAEGSLVFDELSGDSPLTLFKGRLLAQGAGFIPAAQEKIVIEVAPSEPLRNVCDRFLAVLDEDKPCALSSGWVGTQLVQILASLSQSLHQGGIVVDVPPVLAYTRNGI
jgi:predicted dehydrogenase